MSSVWRLPADDRLVISWANVTDEPIEIRFALPRELHRPSDKQCPREKQSNAEVPLVVQVMTSIDCR
ncbi:MAG: hypothetical protein KDB05_29970 [Planctomycetales bacterium]|nr:hypothetical protein [Planctomycetales bacterium]